MLPRRLGPEFVKNFSRFSTSLIDLDEEAGLGVSLPMCPHSLLSQDQFRLLRVGLTGKIQEKQLNSR